MTDERYARYLELSHPELEAYSLLYTEPSRAEALPSNVGYLRQRRDGRYGVYVGVPLDAATARALDERVFALSGHDALVDSVRDGQLPHGVDTLALRATGPAAIDRLADSAPLDAITSLVLLDDDNDGGGGGRSEALARLLARPLPALRSLSIFGATNTLVRSLTESLLGRLETLAIHAPVSRGALCAFDLERVLSGDRRSLTTFELTRVPLGASAIAAWTRGDWSRLERLRLRQCTVEGASLGPFPALRELRSTAYDWSGPAGLGDSALVSIIERSPLLEIVDLEQSAAGDLAALALAEHGRNLLFLNLDKSRVGSPGALALARSTVFERLEFFQLDAGLSFDAAYALTDSATPAIRADAKRDFRGLKKIATWRPTPPPAGSAAVEPPPVRAFRWQRHEECPDCGGHIPWDGCPWHQPLVIHPVERGAEPPTERAREWVAARCAWMNRVEQLGRQMLEVLRAWGKYDGAVRVTWWVLDRVHRGCSRGELEAALGMDAIIDAVGRPSFADSPSWAHACARAREQRFPSLPDPYGPARAIADLGASIAALDPEDGLLIELRAE
jgi:hypothetical protein